MSPIDRLNQLKSNLISDSQSQFQIMSKEAKTQVKDQAQAQAQVSNVAGEFLDDYIFFGHDTVNRVSFLRQDADFIKISVTHPSTKIAVFNNDQVYGSLNDPEQIYYSSYGELKSEIDQWEQYNRNHDVKLNDLRFTFLGVDERIADINSGVNYKGYNGIAYFAVDITFHEDLITHFENKAKLITSRDDIFKLSSFNSGIFSHSKMYLDWLRRNKFCAGCGSPTVAIHAGTKLQCTSTLEIKCPVKNAKVSNISFPRTDPVIITAVTNDSFTKVLLGRGRRFPGKLYSTIAGFVEPSESIEIASLRELWEETGVKGYKCEIIKTQPWPYPANLMIGCCAFVEFNGINEKINLGHDPELVDAKWVDIEELKDLVYNRAKYDYQIPKKTAIAYHLLRYVCQKHDELSNS